MGAMGANAAVGSRAAAPQAGIPGFTVAVRSVDAGTRSHRSHRLGRSRLSRQPPGIGRRPGWTPRRRDRRRHRRANRPGPIRRQSLDRQDGHRRGRGRAGSRRRGDPDLGNTSVDAPARAHVARPRPLPRCRPPCEPSLRPRGPLRRAHHGRGSGRFPAAFGRGPQDRPRRRADPRDGLDAGLARRNGGTRPHRYPRLRSSPAHPRRFRGRDRVAGARRREAQEQGRGSARRQRRHRAGFRVRHGHEQGDDLFGRFPPEELPLMSKREVAELLLDRVVVRLLAAVSVEPTPPAADPAVAPAELTEAGK